MWLMLGVLWMHRCLSGIGSSDHTRSSNGAVGKFSSEKKLYHCSMQHYWKLLGTGLVFGCGCDGVTWCWLTMHWRLKFCSPGQTGLLASVLKHGLCALHAGCLTGLSSSKLLNTNWWHVNAVTFLYHVSWVNLHAALLNCWWLTKVCGIEG